jgi:hypothetical protein
MLPAAGATSIAGLAAFAVKQFFFKGRAETSNETGEEQNENRRNGN